MVDVAIQVVENPLALQVAEHALRFGVEDTAPAVFSIVEEQLMFPTRSETLNFQVGGPTVTFVVDAVGLQGPPGEGGEEMAYAKRIDWISETVLYKGEALPGALPSEAAWRIRRITLASDDDVTEEWAGGSAEFTNIWDNRGSLSYS